MPCCGCAFWQHRVWPHSEIFTGRRPVKLLLGSSPNPLNFWTLCPEVPAQAPVVGGPELTLLGLIFARPHGRAGDRHLPDCHGLPHIRLGLAVFRVKGFFFRRAPGAAFQRVHFGSFAPPIKLTHGRLAAQVVCQLRLVLARYFLLYWAAL